MNVGLILRRVAEAAVLGGLFALNFCFPASSGWGFLEALMAFLFPVLFFDAVFKGRRAGWLFLACFLGVAMVFHWVPATLELRGPLPRAVALLGAGLLVAWEALGCLLVALAARFAFRRSGPWAAAFMAAFGLVAWEMLAFHVYPWTWGGSLGGLPWLARSAAFLSVHGLSAWCWGCGAFAAVCLASEQSPSRVLTTWGAWLTLPMLLSLGWFLLPRGAEHRLDVVMVQPNYEPGTRLPSMEADMWQRTDDLLRQRHWPRAGTPTLVLWPESSILGRDDRGAAPRLAEEAQKRGVAWLFGTEGGPLNLVRGEAAGRPSFLQAKVELMPFGERMPGPEAMRKFLEQRLGFLSLEPGELNAQSSFEVDGWKAHPLVCSEALIPLRMARGLRLAGGELLTNHTNDGWFEKSIATNLHAAQIRLRAVEAGLPMLRATLTGKSGVFHENGTWELWDEPRSEAAYALSLQWRPRWTPARHSWLLWGLLLGLGTGALVTLRIRKA